MVERCPHCHHDVLFSRSICPACGLTSKPEDRTEQTDIQRQQVATPNTVYTLPFEQAMTNAERRGRIELGLITGVLLLPDLVVALAGLFRLQFPWPSLLRLVVLYVLAKGLWRGRAWARLAAQLVTFVGGSGVCLGTYAEHLRLTPAHQMLFYGAGLTLLLAAVPLWFSQDLTDYLRRRRLLPDLP